MKRLFHCTLLVLLVFSMYSCAPKKLSEDRVQQILQDNPEIVLSVLENDSIRVANIVEQGLQARAQKSREERLQHELANPLDPSVNLDRPVLGNKNAPITIVEYSDFLCPYCSQAAETIRSVIRKNPDSYKFFYKHLPQQPFSYLAALYFEAIGMQDHHLAWVFHDKLYENQQKLADEGEKFLVQTAQSLKIDMKRLSEDVKSEQVRTYVNNDIQEGKSFNFRGTPMFLINGVTVEGAVSEREFERIIEIVRKNPPGKKAQ